MVGCTVNNNINAYTSEVSPLTPYSSFFLFSGPCSRGFGVPRLLLGEKGAIKMEPKEIPLVGFLFRL